MQDTHSSLHVPIVQCKTLTPPNPSTPQHVQVLNFVLLDRARPKSPRASPSTTGPQGHSPGGPGVEPGGLGEPLRAPPLNTTVANYLMLRTMFSRGRGEQPSIWADIEQYA